MTTPLDDRMEALFPGLAAELRRNWGWLLALGILLLALGIVAVGDSVFATVASMIFFGWILLIGGVVEAVQGFRHRHGHHLFLHALNAVLAIVAGGLLLWAPLAGAVVVTLLLALYFCAAGLFRIITALSMRVAGWGWVCLSGVVTLALGLLVAGGWPVSGLWVIGLFIGIEFIFAGWAQIMMAFAARALPARRG